MPGIDPEAEQNKWLKTPVQALKGQNKWLELLKASLKK